MSKEEAHTTSGSLVLLRNLQGQRRLAIWLLARFSKRSVAEARSKTNRVTRPHEESAGIGVPGGSCMEIASTSSTPLFASPSWAAVRTTAGGTHGYTLITDAIPPSTGALGDPAAREMYT